MKVAIVTWSNLAMLCHGRLLLSRSCLDIGQSLISVPMVAAVWIPMVNGDW